MPHEQLTALLASLIPLIPLFHSRGDPLHIAWGSTTANTETYAPKYLQSAARNQEALDGLFGHARSVRCALGLRWLQEAVTLPSDTPLPGLEALEAIRTHFVDNVAAPSLVVWAIGFATLALLLLWDVASTSALDWGPNSNASRRLGDPVTNPRFVTPSDGCLETSLSYHPPERWHAASVSDKSGETPTLSSPTPSGDLVNFGATAGSASSQPVPPTLLSSYTPLSLPSGLTSTVVPSLVSPEAAQSTHLAGHDVPPNSTQAAGTKVDRDVPQYHARMLSSITEISEPGESDRSVSGTPRVQWFSSIHGRFASLDTHGLTLQMQAHSEGTTPSSSPDVHVAFGSGWSLIGAPSEVHEPLQLNASPDMHEDIGPEGGLTCVSDHSLGVGIPALPAPPAFGGIAPLGLDREPASEADIQWHLDVSPGPRPSDDGVAVPALATSCTNADTYHKSLMEPTWNTPSASSSDLLPLDTEETLVVAPICAALGATPARMTSPGPALANIATSDACEVVRAGASLPVPSVYPIRSSSSTVVPVSASPELSVLLSAPTQPPVVATSPRPMVTHIRRTSRILVARTGIAGQQVALTDAGLACAVGLLDKPLPLDEDVRGERRRMERVTDTLLESHSADRGLPRDKYEVIHELQYTIGPIPSRAERNIVDAERHPPLQSDPHVRVPVCELGRSRSSKHPHSTTNVVLVRRPSVSSLTQDVRAPASLALTGEGSVTRSRSLSDAAGMVADVIGEGLRPSYATIAATAPSNPLLRPRVRSQQASSASMPPSGTSKPKARKREPSFSTPAKKLRNISAPASCPTRPSAASSGSHAVPRVSRYRSGWRNGNRWSALLFSPPLSSSEESRTRTLDKRKARGQEHLELVMESPLASSRGAPEANRWPDSAILKESMLASLAMVGKTPATTSSFSAVSEMRAVSAGNARMHGSLLSAASRVRLRDLARQARCGVVAPLVNAASTSVTSSSSVAPILNNDLVSGLLATSVSRATSTNDSSSCGHDFVPSSGPCDASASSSYGLSAVLDVEMASLCNEGNADVSDASSEFAATSALTRPVRDRCSLVVGDSAHMSTSHDTSLREPAFLLPPLSDFDLHFMSKAMDERASLVIASQDDGKSEPTGRGEAIVRLKASGTRVLWPQCPPHSRRSTAPPTPFSSPMLPLGNASPSRSPTVFATQRYAHPNERPSNVAQGHTYPNASWKSEQHFSSPAFAHYRRATTGVVGEWVQGGFSPSSRSTWWRREQS